MVCIGNFHMKLLFTYLYGGTSDAVRYLSMYHHVPTTGNHKYRYTFVHTGGGGGGGGGEEEEEEELTLCRGGSSLKFVTIKFNVLHYASTREEGGRKRERSKERFRTDRARLRESLLRITTL